MTTRKTYSEKLLDPRWQKKRLEILQAANWTCQSCKATDKTLQIHHLYYESGVNPWEYPNESLLCLCDECHKSRQEAELYFDKHCRSKLSDMGLSMCSKLVSAAVIIGEEDRKLPELFSCLSNEWAPWEEIIGICSTIALLSTKVDNLESELDKQKSKEVVK